MKVSHIHLGERALSFSPPVTVYHSIWIDKHGPQFSCYVPDFGIISTSRHDHAQSNDRLIKEIFRMWDACLLNKYSKSKKDLNILSRVSETPYELMMHTLTKNNLDDLASGWLL